MDSFTARILRCFSAGLVVLCLGHLATADTTAAPTAAAQTLTMTSTVSADLQTWPLHAGVPFAPGALRDAQMFTLRRNGKPVAVQTQVLATWGPPGSELGNSIKWLGVDLIDSVQAGVANQYEFALEAAAAAQPALRVEDGAEQILIHSGRLELVINKGPRGFNGFDAVRVDGHPAWQSGAAVGPYVVDGNDVRYLASADRAADVRVERQGPLVAVVRAEGWFVNPQATGRQPVTGEPTPRPVGGFCRYVTRLYITANQPDVRIQHTFIFTEDSQKEVCRDIGIELPMQRQAPVQINGKAYDSSQHVYLLQKSDVAFDVAVMTGAEAKSIDQGERADGTIATGNVAVTIRDFWQNYPKELEADPAAGRMNLHLWPLHGTPRLDNPQTLTDVNAWLLPWVHSGAALDFRVPEILKDAKAFPKLHGGAYITEMYRANAIGVARTHDLLLAFAPDQAQARRAAFQAAPHLLPDPHYLCATGVIGPVLASEPEKRPLPEHYMNHGMKWQIRAMENYHSFGMWNYGDTNSMFFIEEGKVRPEYRRLWASTHYNSMRLAWWLYMRGGDPVILRHAQRQNSHIMDVDVCHWTNDFFSKHEYVDDTRKAVGGLCDYKGVVHWHAGERNCYNSGTDYMLYDYYLTGNGRAWDIAMEHGYYAANTARADQNREAAGQADAIIELYKATWDPKIKEKLDYHVKRIFARSENVTDDLLDWTPWIQRYWDLTQDPAAKDLLLRRMDTVGGGRLYNHAYAYYMTGEHKYAVSCAKQILLSSISTVVRDDDYDGMVGRFGKTWIDESTGMVLALQAAQNAKLSLHDFAVDQWHTWNGWGLNASFIGKSEAEYFHGALPWPAEMADTRRMTAVVYHDGSEKTLWLGCLEQFADRATISVTAPDGKVLKEYVSEGAWHVVVPDAKTVVKRTWKDGKLVNLATAPYVDMTSVARVAGDSLTLTSNHPAGFYRVVWNSPAYFHPLPVLSPDGKVWVRVGAQSTMTLSGFQFFYVPADCASFTLSFLPNYTKGRFFQKMDMATGVILNPYAEAAATVSCGLATEPQVITVKVPAGQDGQTWCIAGEGFCVTSMQGVPPYISPSYQAFQGAPHAPPN